MDVVSAVQFLFLVSKSTGSGCIRDMAGHAARKEKAGAINDRPGFSNPIVLMH